MRSLLRMDVILWKNDAFSKLTQSSRKEKYLYRMIPALTTSVFPKDDMEHVEMEVEYCDRHYQAELRRVSLHGFKQTKGKNLLQIPEEEEIFRSGIHAGCNRIECVYPRK